MTDTDVPAFAYHHRAPEAGSGPAPVVVLLHGYGSSAGDMMGLAPWLDPRFLVLAPQGARPLPNGGWGWYPLGVGPVAPVLDTDELEASRGGVLDWAAAAAPAHGGDARRLFLVGFSQGAALALAAALVEPERVAALVAMSGRVVPEILPRAAAPARMRGLSVLLTHGADDEIVPVAQGRAARDMLSERGARVELCEYPVGHALSPDCLDTVEAWLAARLDDPPGAETPAPRGG